MQFYLNDIEYGDEVKRSGDYVIELHNVILEKGVGKITISNKIKNSYFTYILDGLITREIMEGVYIYAFKCYEPHNPTNNQGIYIIQNIKTYEIYCVQDLGSFFKDGKEIVFLSSFCDLIKL